MKVSPSTVIGVVLLVAAGLIWMRQKPATAPTAPPAPELEAPSRPVIFLQKITPPPSTQSVASIPSPAAEALYQEAWELVHRSAIEERDREPSLQRAREILLNIQHEHPTWQPVRIQRRLLQTADLLQRNRIKKSKAAVQRTALSALR